MNKSQFLCLLTCLLSANLLFSQGEVLIKNHPETLLIVNNDYSNEYTEDLKLSSKETDNIVVEIQKDSYAVKKKISLANSLGYAVTKTSKGDYKLRLRNSIQLENSTALFIDTIKPAKMVGPSFIDSLKKQEFEFDKVNVLITRLREIEENNENLAKYLLTLEHDFSKWQVLEVITSENLLQLDYTAISQTLDSDVYKERLKSLFESK